MYVNSTRNLAYIRVPATGSTTFLASFPGDFWIRDGSDHETLSKALPRTSGLKVVTVIRHPMDWLKSIYWMTTRAKGHWLQFVSGDYDPEISPEAFLDQLTVAPLDWVTVDGEVRADRVYRIEDLAEICKELGGNPAQPLNKTESRPSVEWPEEAVRMKFAREYAHY